MNIVKVNADLIMPVKAGNGQYYLPLNYILGDAIDLAEGLFGKRDSSYTLLGMYFCEEALHPCIVYHPNNENRVFIELTANTLQNRPRACYQLCHEVIHLLAPDKYNKNSANNLEEGIAVWFSLYCMNKFFPGSYNEYYSHIQTNPDPTVVKYRDAFNAVSDIIKDESDCIKIKELREIVPSLSRMGKDLIETVFPDNAEFLAKKFN